MSHRVTKANVLRERYYAVLKKTIDSINTLTNEACPSTIAVYRNELETNWSNFSSAYNEHEDSIIGTDEQNSVLVSISSEYRDVHNNYLKAKIKIGKLTSGTNLNATMANASMLEQSFSGEPTKTCKLPPIRIQTFSGEMKEWMEFKATCRSVLTDKIHEVQRLQLLKDSLKGEPRELVMHILPAEGAYEKAMFLLKKRYENTRAVVNDQLRRLYTIPHNEPNAENLATLRSVINTIHSLRAALESCDIDTSTWDSILIFNTSQCLHHDSRKAWEEKLEGTRAVPSLEQYIEFLETRVIILETTQTFAVATNQSKGKPFTAKVNAPMHSHSKERARILFTLRSDYKCTICQRNHLSSRCDELERMPIQDRKTAVQKANACFNCLQSFHMCAQCPFEPACKKCNGKHHTLLHEDKQNVMLTQTEEKHETEPLTNNALVEPDALSMICSEHFYHIKETSATILATALVPVRWNGRSIVLKALIDQGSTASLITERACQLLNLPYIMDYTRMVGIDNTSVGRGIGKTQCEIGSAHDQVYQFDIDALVVKRITEILPTQGASMHKWKHLSGLKLADPEFMKPHKIDLLLGAAVYAEIVLGNVVKGEPGEPIAQLTKLGYIIFGPVQIEKGFKEFCHALQDQPPEDPEDNIAQRIKDFWSIEEVDLPQQFTTEEVAAENAFVQGLKRAADGKFIVNLPFKLDPNSMDCLGDSRAQAEKRLLSTQRRFNRNPSVKAQHDQNIEEYLTLGHMSEIESHEVARCFLPHHPVIKESSSTTKVRTVYDASAKTSNGRSLNDILYVGPTIQLDLFDLLIQWRRYRFAFSGDIEKMYRQIWVDPNHALFQCILWQPPGSDKIKEYKLLTVTFGTASAPFQAIRAVDEVGRRIENENPMLAEQIRKHFYVDDYLGSADDIETAIALRTQITGELAKYGFHLRKWKANDERILQHVQSSEREEVIDFDTVFKTLGISWQPSTDMFQFKSSTPKATQWTKRKILSEIAKLFDPLGWLAPCVVKAKMLMQDIWRLSDNFNWDTPVPTHIENKWQQIHSQLCQPIPIRVPRWIGLTNDASHIEIHGFCDASTAAYAAVVYIKIKYSDETIVCNLVASKTKLAPIKTVTIPRLELCGAALLTKLLDRCVHTLALTDCPIHAWSDSMIVLAWLTACPSRWSVFVSNRVSIIQKSLPIEHWKHVPTKLNPADIASRGALVDELGNSDLWWHGPAFLKSPDVCFEQPEQLSEQDIPERKKNVQIFHFSASHETNYVLERFPSYKRLLRFTVYAMRWYGRAQNRDSVIKANEIALAERKWIKIIQSEVFGKEIYDIINGRYVNAPALRQLNPFIDNHHVLRMNGRVGNADLMEQKTAIILPPKHHLTTLIIRDAHEQVLHGGVQLTLRNLREKFWIIHARRQVQGLIHKCVRCFRFRKQFMQQQMADLPAFRVEQARPFAFVGCDYAGPFEIKVSTSRKSPVTKGYIALFICLTTKALHLELACDLSAAEFIMAFENFIARRGVPVMLYNDNGTNFIGGAKEIRRFHEQLFSANNAFTRLLAQKNIEFKRLPPRASHMAGIWERAVGSVKYHLRRTLKKTSLTPRQFDHVLKQIEACLNSRPLWAVSPESDDIEVLTPSHFFNFQAINTLPRPDLGHIGINRLDQYQYLYRLYCDFWKAWSVEYLHQMQPRTKWFKEQPNALVGQIVLIAEDNLPPSRWVCGKVVEVFPAPDGLVRTVDVRMATTEKRTIILRRPIHKLALLPIRDNQEIELSAQRGENVGERAPIERSSASVSLDSALTHK